VGAAGRPAGGARLALAGEPDARAILDPGRHVDGERALARDPARSGAGRTRVVNHLAAAVTARAGALEREEALGVPDPSVAPAGRAGFRLRSGLGARAGAGFASDRRWNSYLRGLAGDRLLGAAPLFGAQARAAPAPGRAAARARHPKDALENAREGRAEIGAETGSAAGPAVLEGHVAEAIVGGALV